MGEVQVRGAVQGLLWPTTWFTLIAPPEKMSSRRAYMGAHMGEVQVSGAVEQGLRVVHHLIHAPY